MTAMGWGVIGGLILAVSLGIRQTFGLFLGPITTSLDLNTDTFALTLAVQNLLWGISQPFTGYVADRYGTARVIVLGGVCYALGLFFMATSTSSVGLMIGGGLLIGLAVSACGFSVVLGAVGRRSPPAERSRALGIASALGSAGQFVAVPLAYEFTNQYGWSDALLLFIPIAAMMMIMAIALKGRGPSHPKSKEGELQDILSKALRNRSFWMLNGGFAICGFHVAFIATYLPSYANFCSISSATATVALSIIGLMNIPGSLLAGYLGGRYRKKYLLAGIYLFRAIGIAVFMSVPSTATSLLVLAAVMGTLWLATVPLTNGLIAELFGTRYLATLFGIVFFSHQIGAFFGSWLAAPLFLLTGHYDLIGATLVSLALVAVALHLMMRDDQNILSGETLSLKRLPIT